MTSSCTDVRPATSSQEHHQPSQSLNSLLCGVFQLPNQLPSSPTTVAPTEGDAAELDTLPPNAFAPAVELKRQHLLDVIDAALDIVGDDLEDDDENEGYSGDCAATAAVGRCRQEDQPIEDEGRAGYDDVRPKQ